MAKREIKKKLFLIFTGSGIAALFFACGFYFSQSRLECEVCPPSDINFSLFWETYRQIKSKYVDPSEIDEDALLYGAISGMVKAVGDPYTVFMDPKNTGKFIEDISGEFEGVGMEIGIRDDVLQVIAPLEGTPAEKAGLRAGDKILTVNGEATSGLSIEELVMRIRGEKGTEITLGIEREGWDAPQEFKIIRDTIEVPALDWELIDKDIAHIEIYHFTQKSGIEFAKAAMQIKRSGAEKIILDLRNNPGGYLEIAREISGYFLNRGEVVVIEDTGKGQEEFKAQGNPIFLNYPLVILINQGSASASEILAGALRSNKGTKLIGEKSFGKGSVQELINLRDGASLKVTIAKWLTPSGETIEETGLEPDIRVEMTEEDINNGKDPQLDKAIEVLNSEL